MPNSFKNYTAQFFWDFKRMDNVNYNFKIIELLYIEKKKNNNNPLFIKPIIIILISIIECMLFDFIIRVQTHRNDKIPNLEQDIIDDIKGKEVDQFEVIIAQIEKQNLLRAPPDEFTVYSDLKRLRQIRNRIHIQDTKQDLDKDDYNVFTESNLRLAEKMLERVCEVLCNVYPRWGKRPLLMADFPRPWL
jgi:hypothetical protein